MPERYSCRYDDDRSEEPELGTPDESHGNSVTYGPHEIPQLEEVGGETPDERNKRRIRELEELMGQQRGYFDNKNPQKKKDVPN